MLRRILSVALVTTVVCGVTGPIHTAFAAAASPAIPGEYIVVLREGVAKTEGFVNRLVQAHGGQLLHDYGVIRGFSVRLPDTQLERLRANPSVAYIEPNFEALAPPTAAAARSGSGSGTTSTQPAEKLPIGLKAIRADRSVATGAGIRVAVIDTGIDLNHPDLVANLGGSVDFTRSRVKADDENGHGTHVAGTIAAVRGNGIGVAGVAPRAQLWAVKVLDRRGSGSYADVIAGIDWAWKHGMKVGNLSLGGGADSTALHDALRNGAAAGIIWVVAAGNDGADASTSYPAAYDDAVIAVSANWWEDDGAGNPRWVGWPTFSNYGRVVDVSAPGVYVESTWKGGTYQTLSGTSMAAPHVSGVVALLMEREPWLGFEDVRRALLAGALDVPNIPIHPEEMVGAGAY